MSTLLSLLMGEVEGFLNQPTYLNKSAGGKASDALVRNPSALAWKRRIRI